MKKSSGEGLPISTSLTPILAKEKVQPKREESKRRILTISSLSFLIACATCIIAKFLVLLIDVCTNLAFYGRFSVSHASPADNLLGWWVIFVPAVGGVIVGLMAFYGSKAIRGHGIPEAMEQILTNQSKIKPTITYLKPLSSAISIGTGGPFGAEGPIIATGGALGSTIGQMIKISAYERKILLASGATAGMAAVFGSPLAAIFLAVELLLFEFSSRSIIPVAIACITGAAGHHLLFGRDAIFSIPDVPDPDNIALAVYTVIGILVGIISVGVSKTVYLVEEGFEKLPIHWMWWPALGGLVVGVVGYFAPHTLGVGYDNIANILAGNLTLKVLFSLCLLKFISWVIALGSGTSGGTLAPLLTIGGATGALLGTFIIPYFPQSEISLSLAALVGMAAMFAGASRALLTSIVFALETTMQSDALLPLLGACVASYIVSYFLMEHNIMTEKIARKGIKTPSSYKPNVLEKFNVSQVFESKPIMVNHKTSIAEIQKQVKQAVVPDLPEHLIVINDQEQYLGIVSVARLLGHDADHSNEQVETLARQVYSTNETDTLLASVELMALDNSDILIVESDAGKGVIGTLTLKNILKLYKHEMDENTKGQAAISLKRKFLKIVMTNRMFYSKKD